MSLTVKQIEWAIKGMELYHVEGEGCDPTEQLLEDFLADNGVVIQRTPHGMVWSRHIGGVQVRSR